MKKFAAGLLVAAIMINGAVAFAADGAITSISTDPDTQYITVSGTIASETGRERVTLRITKKGETPNKDTIVCTYQVNTNENGAYSFGFSMPEGAAAEEYDAYVKANSGEDKQSFRYFGDVSSELETKVNGASNASALRKYLEDEDGMEKFGIDEETYDTLTSNGKDFVASAVYTTERKIGGFDSGKQLRDTFDQAVTVEQIREGKEEITDENISALTVNYSKTVSGGYGTYQTLYNSASKADASVATKALEAVKASSVKDTETFWNTYNNSVINTIIANTEYWTEVRDFIADNKELIGEYANIDWTKYNSNAQAVCKQLVRGNYATLGTFAAAVKGAIDEAVNPTSSSTVSGGGGGGGGGGTSSGSDGSIKSSSVTLPVPETAFGTTDNTTEAVTSDPYKFDDVRRTPWANDAVSYLVDRKIISGYGDGTFRPENSITRAEFVTLVIKAFYGSYEMTDCDFDDVPKDSWAYPYIAAASNLGLVHGVGENEFAPDTNIKRQDMAVIIKNILDTTEHSGYTEGTQSFDDENEVSGYALEAVRALRAEGIVNGDENNNFKPLAQTTRAEAAVIIYNMLNK